MKTLGRTKDPGPVIGCLRRFAERIALGALDRLAEAPCLAEDRRVWLLHDIEEDLDAMVDDAENRRVREPAAREMPVARALIAWLAGGEPPGAEAIEYLERAVRSIPRRAEEDELARRDAYLAAIAELGGDAEAASRLWWEPPTDGQYRALLDFQGRRVRALAEERGLTIGALARRSGIDTVTLVALAFGLEEMGATEWMRLSEALGVPFDSLFEGLCFLPGEGPAGGGFYVIPDGSERPAGPADAPGADGTGRGEAR